MKDTRNTEILEVDLESTAGAEPEPCYEKTQLRSWSHAYENRELRRRNHFIFIRAPQSLVLILTYWSWILVMTEIILTQVQAPEMGFLRRVHGVTQERTKIRWHPGQETRLAPSCSKLRSFGTLASNLRHY